MLELTTYELMILRGLREAKAGGEASVELNVVVTFLPPPPDEPVERVEIGKSLRLLRRRRMVRFEHGDRITITETGLTEIQQQA